MNELKRLSHMVSEIEHVFHEISLHQGLPDSSSAVLYTLCNCGGSCPLADILRYTGIPKQTVNSALRKLEREGVLYLEQTGIRTKTVILTESGRLLTRDTVEKTIRMENGILGSWTEEERNLYLTLTQRYLDQLKEGTKELCR